MQLASGFFMHIVLALIMAAFLGEPVRDPPSAAPEAAKPLIWTAKPPGLNGGGRGGDGAKAAAATRPPLTPHALPRFRLPQMPDLLTALVLPGAEVLAAAGPVLPGVNDGLRGGGRGEATGGPGSGSGAGAGAGTGAGPFPDGTPGLTSPQVVFERKPEYTAEAMSARIQGPVLIEATVLADGTVGPVRVLRSMDRSYGLDQKALEAVRAWRFKPGSYRGKPVAVKVLVELMFSLR